jgi:hypothetical protein
MAPLPALPEGCSSTLVVHVRSSESINARSYWIPGFYAPPVFEKRSVLLRQLKKKGFKEEWVAKVGADDPDNSPTLESNKSLQEERLIQGRQHRLMHLVPRRDLFLRAFMTVVGLTCNMRAVSRTHGRLGPYRPSVASPRGVSQGGRVQAKRVIRTAVLSTAGLFLALTGLDGGQ